MELVQTDRLSELEAVIEHGLRTFAEVGAALTEIRDQQLYKSSGYRTFEAYCKERFDMSRPRAYEAINHAEVMGALSAIADIPLPRNEAQTRELLPIFKADPELTIETWRGLQADFGDALTAELVGRRVKEVLGGRNQEAEPDAELHLRGQETRAYNRETDGLRGFGWYKLTYCYEGPNGNPLEWNTGMIYLDHQTPVEDQDVIDLARSVGQTFARELFRRPLPTMKRKVG